MTDEPNGIEEARAARRRAEADLAAMKAQRPEVKRLAQQAVRLRDQNHLAELVAIAFGRGS